MDRKKEEILCDDCGAHFKIEYESDGQELIYCPFCGADLNYWDEDEDLDDEPDVDEDWWEPYNEEHGVP